MPTLRMFAVLAMALLLASPAFAQDNAFPIGSTSNVDLPVDERLYNASGSHYLLFQSDGNLVVYTSAEVPIWGLNDKIDYRQNTRAIMQSDGNLVTYAGDTPTWATQTHMHAGAVLTLTDEGHLVIGQRAASNEIAPIYWQSASVFPVTGDFEFTPDHSYFNASMSHALRFQSDGNLVVYTAGGAPVWGLNDKADWRGNTRAVMQADGNLVTYTPTAPTWAPMTNGNPNATLSLEDDGALVIRSAAGAELWRSGQ